MIAIVTALREELAPLLRRAKIERVVRIGKLRCHVGTLSGTPVVLIAGGDGLEQAEASVRELLQCFDDVSLLIGAGIAGGIDPALRFGDVIVASEMRGPDGSIWIGQTGPTSAVIRSVERMAGSAEEKRRITDAQVIDTESSGWARAASNRSVPFTVVRVIFDTAEEEIPDFVTGDGPIDRAAVARHAVLHPRTIPGLLQMRSRLASCCDVLADFVARFVAPTDTRLSELLAETSRTFALCIPLLPDSTCRQVTIAYLLFRIADTFEDASHWPVADRLEALDEFCALLRNPDVPEARRIAAVWCAKRPSPHAGYIKLMTDVPLVIEALTALPAPARELIKEHVIRSAQGMAQFVALTENGNLQLASMQQLRDYCYAVAGIVGEMLTELFVLNAPQLRGVSAFLRARATTFGEGLQLVNILKDHLSDSSEGRIYIPPGTARANILALARTDLESATEYTLALQSGGGPDGIIAFAALPVALAQATLDRLERSTGRTKIGRPEVFRITRQVRRSVARGQPPLRRRSQSSSGLARMRSMFSLLFGMR